MKQYEVVQHHIEDQILSGELTVDSPLPAERDLAVQLGVSRTAVREGLRTLAAQGLVTSRVGAGPGGGTRVSDLGTPALGKLLQMHVALAGFPIDEVVECRIMLERFTVAAATRNADAAALAFLGEMLDQMAEPDIELDDFNALDTGYHVKIAELAGNEMAAMLTSAIRHSLALPIRQASQDLSDWRAFRDGLGRQHRLVYEAMVAGDEQLAADLLEEHIRSAYAILPVRGKRTLRRSGRQN